MGYHVAILRTRNGQTIPITKSEVDSLVASLPGSRIQLDERNKNVLNVVITKDGKDVSWLAFQDGKLWTKNPEDNEIQVMIDIAKQLGARVRGDEFETFHTPTETFSHPDDKLNIQRAEESAKQIRKTARSKQLRLNLALILIFLLLAGVATYYSK